VLCVINNYIEEPAFFSRISVILPVLLGPYKAYEVVVYVSHRKEAPNAQHQEDE
jgi:hypothetical protein